MSSASDVGVSIVLVDVDEHPIGPALVESLEGLLAAGERLELLVVDARTVSGRAWAGMERARVLGSDASVGATSLRVRGVRAARADLVAFLDARAVPGPRWLAQSCAMLAADRSVVAVSGASRNIGEPTLSFTGNVGARHPLDERAVHDVLFPVPEASVWRRRALLGPDGLDPALSWPVAVIDLAWRLRLGGWRAVLDPEATVEGRCTCAVDSYGGLVVLQTCLAQAALERALPAAMLVAAHSDTIRAEHAVDRFVRDQLRLADRRAAVQGARSDHSDDGLLELFLTALEPARGDEELDSTYRDASARNALAELFPSRRRILIVTPDVLLRRMAGPAIRAWQIASALAARHEVYLATTSSRSELTSSTFDVSAPSDFELRELAIRADIVIVQGFAMEGRPYLKAEGHILVVDLYDPLHLEQLELFRDADEDKRRVTVFEATRVLNEQLVRGDFFVCASAKQRDFWLGQLAALGRVNHATYDDDQRMRRLLDVVPFGLPDADPERTQPAMHGVIPGIAAGDEVILWGGGIYNWFDPLTLIHAVDRLKERRPAVRLFFLGLGHPNPDVSEMRIATDARRLAKELRLTDRYVFFNEGWVPYEERQNFLLEAAIGISTHFDHVETEFSFRTRILDYIWAGLPIVATDGDWFADLIVRDEVGIVVPAGDVSALEHALERLLSDQAFADSCRRALRRWREEFRWAKALEPIVSFCRDPRRASDLADPRVRRHLWAPDADRQSEWLRAQPSTISRIRRSLSS